VFVSSALDWVQRFMFEGFLKNKNNFKAIALKKLRLDCYSKNSSSILNAKRGLPLELSEPANNNLTVR